MNILVCLKLVSQAQFADSLKESADRLSSGQLAMNPADEYALEMALRLKDRYPDICITVISMAPQYAEHILRTAVAMGADKAVHLCDSAFAGSDTIATSTIIARAIQSLPPQDIILCGRKAIDSETGHIGPQLAERLALPYAGAALDLAMPRKGILEFCRAQDNGIVRVQAKAPLVISLCNSSTMIRSPSIMGLRKSRKAEILLLDSRVLGFDSRSVGTSLSGTETVSVKEMNFRSRKQKSTADTAEGAKLIYTLLREVQQ